MMQRLSLRQIYGWIAWYKRTPRGRRYWDVMLSNQTTAIRMAMHGEKEEPAVPDWYKAEEDARPTTRAERILMRKV